MRLLEKISVSKTVLDAEIHDELQEKIRLLLKSDM